MSVALLQTHRPPLTDSNHSNHTINPAGWVGETKASCELSVLRLTLSSSRRLMVFLASSSLLVRSTISCSIVFLSLSTFRNCGQRRNSVSATGETAHWQPGWIGGGASFRSCGNKQVAALYPTLSDISSIVCELICFRGCDVPRSFECYVSLQHIADASWHEAVAAALKRSIRSHQILF